MTRRIEINMEEAGLQKLDAGQGISGGGSGGYLPDTQGGVLNSGNLTYSCRIMLVGRKNRLNKLLADSGIRSV